MECNLGLQARETLSCLSCFRSECFIVDVDVNIGSTASDSHVVWGMHQQSLLGQLTQTARVPAGKTQVTERCHGGWTLKLTERFHDSLYKIKMFPEYFEVETSSFFVVAEDGPPQLPFLYFHHGVP